MATPILIIDDDPDIRESLGDMLVHEGYDVQSVPDGTEALQRVRRERYSAAVLDVQLPDLNGLSVMKVMMELDPSLPIIVLTGHASQENTVGSLVKGAFAYLTKPYNTQELKAVLRRAVNVKGLVIRAEHVEQALLASEQRFRTLVESAMDAIVLADHSGHIIWWNASAERLFAYPKNEALGQSFTMLLPERYRRVHEASVAALAGGSQPSSTGTTVESVGLTKHGTEFPLDLSIACWTTKEGTFFSAIIRDITARKQAEQDVARLSHHNRLILTSAGEGIFGLDLDGRVTFVNPRAVVMLGWEDRELLGRPMHTILYSAAASDSVPTREATQLYSAIRDGATHRVQNEKFSRKDGTTFPAEYVTSAIREDDTLVGAVVVFKDISERHRMDSLQQTQLAVSHILTESRTLHDAVPHLLKATCELWQWDLAIYWRVDELNQVLRCQTAWHGPCAPEEEFVAICRNATFPPGVDLPGRTWATRGPVWVWDAAGDPAFTRSPTAARIGLHSAAAFPIRSGEQIHGVIELLSRKKRRPDTRLVHTLTDIGMKIGQFIDRETADQSLRLAHEETGRILASLPGAILLCGPQYVVEYENELAHTFLSTNGQTSIGKSLFDCLPVPDPVRHRLMSEFNDVQTSGKNRSLDQEFEDGKRVFRYRFFPVSMQHDPHYRVGMVLWDITDEKQLQDQLIQTEKLASLGTMVSGMAHEINNPAQAILSMAELIQEEQNPDQIRQFAADIVEYARHVSVVVRDFASYARSAGRDGQSDIDVTVRLMEAVKMVRRGPHFGYVDVTTDFVGPTIIRARKAELDQIFVNLISNAVQAMNGKGHLILSTVGEGNYLKITIRDTGCGIPKSVLGKIFDPFFTTKDPGKGTGLGLSIVYRIVTKYEGTIWVESEEGQGTAFHIRFPQASL
ncbi:MAG: PAS domain S-box protein [Nitrospiraceae bacterium]